MAFWSYIAFCVVCVVAWILYVARHKGHPPRKGLVVGYLVAVALGVGVWILFPLASSEQLAVEAVSAAYTNPEQPRLSLLGWAGCDVIPGYKVVVADTTSSYTIHCSHNETPDSLRVVSDPPSKDGWWYSKNPHIVSVDRTIGTLTLLTTGETEICHYPSVTQTNQRNCITLLVWSRF